MSAHRALAQPGPITNPNLDWLFGETLLLGFITTQCLLVVKFYSALSWCMYKLKP